MFVRRQNIFLGLYICSAVSTIFLLRHFHVSTVRDIGYLTRPIWDKPIAQPKIIIPHYHSSHLTSTEICGLHGWKPRRNNSSTQFKVIDAFIFSIELDLLEIRMKELWNVVDVFLVLEATRSFTGKPKPLFLQDNLDSFDWAKSKLTLKHHVIDELLPLAKNETPFSNEIRTRKFMSKLIHSIANSGDLVIVSDADEIPRNDTIQLFRLCEGYPRMVHLQLQNYLYSFDFPLQNAGWQSWNNITDSQKT